MVPGMVHFRQSDVLAPVRENSVFPSSELYIAAILRFIELLQGFQEYHK